MSEHRIVCAAMRCRKTGKIIASVRHWDDICNQYFDGDTDKILEFDDEQGFLDNRYNFLTRQEAWVVANNANQVIRRCGGDTSKGGTLYSENLY